ncbi:YlxQ family RNA-binding protein [Aciduricibacillus chroicocephali]|uniref:YlxQ family RNA-binding protein n=1 Tax=Aciduricibacillus chroicocephali TaxID=3054939 RepID=A0ABY9KY44_9BACI|nr:YlxQ family RNA-binding protein [Bacillaceae bacterium 44XB]
MHNRYLNMLGLALRAGKVSLGEETIVKDIQQRKAKLVIIANDTGRQTMKKLTDKCTYYNIPWKIAGNRDELSGAIGKSGRVAIAILDDGFARKIESMLE